MGESLPPKREKKESRSFQSPGKTESKIDEQSTLERVSRVHRRADSKRENTRWFFYAHKKLIHHHHHHHLLAAPKIGPKRRTHHRAQSASRDVARASKSFPRRVKTTSSLVSRARRGNHPSDLSLAPHISTKSSKLQGKHSLTMGIVSVSDCSNPSFDWETWAWEPAGTKPHHGGTRVGTLICLVFKLFYLNLVREQLQ